jgi:5'(3')-deoxyribonucleotidase
MRAKQFISEKAVSKKQQKFFGIVRAMQKGDMPKSGEAGEVAKDMKKSDVKDFAKTKHKGLPEKKTYEDMFQGLNPKSEIYVDMDGVLADFFGEWKKLVGKDWRELGKDEIEPALKKIRDEDKFWLNIPLTSNAKKLLDIIKQVKGDYKILSSPLANDPNSEPHKRKWIKKNLDFFPPSEVIITKDKAKYATNPDGTPNILIDDYGVNIAAWEGAGGIGFKHKDHKFERTAKKLKAEIEENFQHGIRDYIEEGWSKKYKNSINCSNPKGFSQKAHCAGRKKNEDIDENFADGKKKGKSRPGRVKKSGASCNGSVTALRKRAKNASGEKAKMYHWCANMKSGRKKGK